jgi:hypothetical protein
VSSSVAAAATASSVALPEVERRGDADNDSDGYGEALDDEKMAFGHPASSADARAVTALVKRYYAAGAAGDGAAACHLIYSTLAESVPEDYGRPPGPPSLRGTTCAVVISKMFKPLQRRLSVESATLKVAAVRVSFNLGSVQLGFAGHKPDRYVLVHRELGRWKMDLLVDVGQPVGVE